MFRIIRDITGVAPDIIFTVGGFKIANSTLFGVLIMLLFILFYFVSVRKYSVKPGKMQTGVELAFEGLVELISQITGDKSISMKIIPLVGALIVYIMVSNLLGLIPGLTSITVSGAALFRAPTTDFNTTFGLALGSVVLLQYVSIKDWGVLGHLGKFFKFKEVYVGFKKGLMDGFMAIIDFGIGLLDIVGELAKVVSLSLRLFGNMYAGEVLAMLILGAFAYMIPLLWTTMSLLSGVIQAIVFGSLVTAYYMLSIKPKEEI